MGWWEPAALLPFGEALALAETHLRKESLGALRHAQTCWHSALGLYSQGGTPPDPPEIDENDL